MCLLFNLPTHYVRTVERGICCLPLLQGEGPPFPLPVYTRYRLETQVGTEFPEDLPLASCL